MNIYMKRDDCTGLALGGNKARQLEFLLGDAVQKGATAVITGAGIDSNHCRQLAAACARLGLRTCLILRGESPSRFEGNLLLDVLFGADCRFIPTARFYEDFANTAAAWSTELAADGERPYTIDTLGWDSPSLGLAAIGYVNAALELEDQFRVLGWRPDAIYMCSGAATQAGLLVARQILELDYRVTGISASPFITQKQEVIAAVAERAAALLGYPLTMGADVVENFDEYIGAGYGQITAESKKALQIVGRLEGILLDPTYTAKAFAGLADHIASGQVRRDEEVLFLHTGGAPSLFLERNNQIAI